MSNTFCPINLVYSYNNVTDSTAYIFVNSTCNDVPYANYDLKAEKAKELFKDILEFSNVETLENLSKADIIKKLEEIKDTAQNFETERKT